METKGEGVDPEEVRIWLDWLIVYSVFLKWFFLVSLPSILSDKRARCPISGSAATIQTIG